jgi:hypothetical protein
VRAFLHGANFPIILRCAVCLTYCRFPTDQISTLHCEINLTSCHDEYGQLPCIQRQQDRSRRKIKSEINQLKSKHPANRLADLIAPTPIQSSPPNKYINGLQDIAPT